MLVTVMSVTGRQVLGLAALCRGSETFTESNDVVKLRHITKANSLKGEDAKPPVYGAKHSMTAGLPA
jgi:hypothetical protein